MSRVRRAAGLDVPPVIRGPDLVRPRSHAGARRGARCREVARGGEPCAGLTPEDTGRTVEEYTRHNGPADLLREHIEGVTGT